MSSLTRRDLLRSGVILSAASLAPGGAAALTQSFADGKQHEARQSHGVEHPATLKHLLNMVHHNPGEPLFITKYLRPDYLKRLGFNGEAPRVYIQSAVTYDRYAPGLISPDSATWAWIQRYAHNIDHLIEEHTQAGLPLYPFTDLLVLPRELMDAFGSEMRDAEGHLSIQRPRTQEVMRAQIEAIFRRFPALDGLTTRFGETYLSDTPFHAGDRPVRTPEEHTLLINILRDEICVKRGKTLFYRTWDFGMLHTQPGLYLRATNAVDPHPKLFFSIKHSNADYLRDVPRNKTLGIGRHAQIVEVSMMQAGCYGRGAYPYYIAHGVLHGWPELGPHQGIDELLRDGKLAGLYTWTRGDGWSGPYISNEFWTDLNLYVITQFALRPHLDDKTLFHEYCTEKLQASEADARRLYELALLSEHAVFIGAQSAVFHIEPWWQRDDKLTDADLKGVDETKVLAEKGRATAEWQKIETLSRQIHLKNASDQEYLQVSSTYGRIYFSIIEQLWTLQLLEKHPRDEANTAARLQALAAYDRLWLEWQKLECDHACCATLYMAFWPQTYPPTWREHPYEGKAQPNHDTPVVARCRAAV